VTYPFQLGAAIEPLRDGEVARASRPWELTLHSSTCSLMSGLMSLLFVLLHHSSSCHFLRPFTVAAGTLRAIFDVLVLTLFFITYASQTFSFWHLSRSLLESTFNTFLDQLLCLSKPKAEQ
jgi:ABC-type uncharacterized transport system permease subunit